MPPGLRALGGGAQQLELQLGQRPRAPAQVGTAREHAEAGARRVDERAVEADLVELAQVGRDDADVRRRRSLRHRARARAGCSSTAVTSPAQHRDLPPGAAQRVEHALAVAASRRRAPRAARRGSSGASRSVSTRSTTYAPGTSVGSPTGSSARTSSAGGSFCARISASASSRPKSRAQTSKIQSGYECLTRPLGQRRDEPAEALREPAHDGVRERRRRARASPRARARPRRRRPRARPGRSSASW